MYFYRKKNAALLSGPISGLCHDWKRDMLETLSVESSDMKKKKAEIFALSVSKSCKRRSLGETGIAVLPLTVHVLGLLFICLTLSNFLMSLIIP